MLLKVVQQNKLIGFSFYPLLENVLGVFFLFVAFFVPILFFKNNGIKFEQWDEWLFCLVFFIFFGFLGYNLGYQNMKVEIKDNLLHLRQDMRGDEVKLEVNLDDWQGVVKETKVEKNENMYFIYIKTKSDSKLFYQTRSVREANEIGGSLEKIYKDKIGEENGTK